MIQINKLKGWLGLCLLLIGSGLAMAQTPTPSRVVMPTPSPPQLGAKSYILVDYNSGRVLAERDADRIADIASMTKMMTSYVVFKELASGNVQLSDPVPVSENAWRTGGSRMFIEPGMEVTVEQMIMGVVIQSGNDASVALAEFLAGTEEAFAQIMNAYAQELGMTNSNFINSTGLPDENHYSTPRDMATLSAALVRDFPQYYPWYSQKEFTFNGIRQHNRNNLLWRDPAVDGLKTGHTEAAGYCLASSAKRDGMRLVSVVMGSASEQSRASESQSLLSYGFRFFETVQLYREGDKLATAQVWKGEAEEVEAGIGENLFVTIPRGRYEDLEARLNMQSEIMAPVAVGQELGRISIYLDDTIVAERPLLAQGEIAEAGFFGRAWDGMSLWMDGFFEDDEEAAEESDD